MFLDLKLLHHDESIHSWFAWNLLTKGEYVYDPVYHGPFLYYVTAGIFGIFGASDFTGRILPALFGSLLVGLVYPVYRLGYLNKRQTVFAALFLAISPDLIYFSRFLRNDIFVVFFTLLLLVALLYYIERKELKYALLAGVAAGLGLAAKENMPIVFLIFGSYLLYLIYTGRFTLPKTWIRDFVLSVFLMGGILALFYSSFGAHPEILIEGPVNAISHWTAMHNQQRLGGPAYFYIILFLLYELPVLLLGIAGVYDFIRCKKQGISVACETAKSEYSDTGMNTGKSAETASSLTTFDKNREFTRFCIYWMILSLLVYAYLGEKVPWLILHQLVPMIFVAVYNFEKWKVWLSAAGIIFLLLMTAHVAFTPADISEPIVQVQNSEDLRFVMEIIDSADRVAISNEVRWPFVWYYINDYPDKVSYYPEGYDAARGPEDYDVIILYDVEKVDKIPGFEKYSFKKSYWISVYDLIKTPWQKGNMLDSGYRQLIFSDIKSLIGYYFTRDAKTGSINLDVFVKSQ
uniref:flippase activity-associated protein Agl23 n=1 Tax=Methanochimaera problematica TaxID=2609417 RepID=UPI0038CD93BA